MYGCTAKRCYLSQFHSKTKKKLKLPKLGFHTEKEACTGRDGHACVPTATLDQPPQLMPISTGVTATTVGRRRQIAVVITTAIASIQISGAFVVPSVVSTATAASVLSAGRANNHRRGLTMSSPVGPEERVVIIGGGIGEARGRTSGWWWWWW